MLVMSGISAGTARAEPPEAVDPAFLDYLGTVEGKDDNWTVVASAREKKRISAASERKPKPEKPATGQAKPAEAKP